MIYIVVDEAKNEIGIFDSKCIAIIELLRIARNMEPKNNRFPVHIIEIKMNSFISRDMYILTYNEHGKPVVNIIDTSNHEIVTEAYDDTTKKQYMNYIQEINEKLNNAELDALCDKRNRVIIGKQNSKKQNMSPVEKHNKFLPEKKIIMIDPVQNLNKHNDATNDKISLNDTKQDIIAIIEESENKLTELDNATVKINQDRIDIYNKKRELKREIEKKQNARKKFDANVLTYKKIKTDLENNEIPAIPALFQKEYDILRSLEEEGLFEDLDNAYLLYTDLHTDIEDIPFKIENKEYESMFSNAFYKCSGNNAPVPKDVDSKQSTEEKKN